MGSLVFAPPTERRPSPTFEDRSYVRPARCVRPVCALTPLVRDDGRMGDCSARVYRNGVLEAEDFPLAEVSDYLAEPDTLVWVDFCAPTQATARRARGASSACTSSPSKTRSATTNGPSSTTTTRTSSCRATPSASTPTTATLDETEIDAFISDRWLITVRKDEGFSMEPRAAALGPLPRPCSATASASCSTGCSMSSSTATSTPCRRSTTSTTRSAKASSPTQPLDPAQQRHWFQMRRALVRFHRLVVPMREAVSGLMRRETRSGLRGAVSLLPRRLRPHPARHRVDRRAARPRQHDRRDRTSACATTARTRS